MTSPLFTLGLGLGFRVSGLGFAFVMMAICVFFLTSPFGSYAVLSCAELKDRCLPWSFCVYGRWPMAYGLWPMASSLWLMACGLWLMAYGPWPMAEKPMPHGLWPMAEKPMSYSLWPMAYGLGPMAFGLWPMALLNSKPPFATAEGS